MGLDKHYFLETDREKNKFYKLINDLKQAEILDLSDYSRDNIGEYISKKFNILRWYEIKFKKIYLNENRISEIIELLNERGLYKYFGKFINDIDTSKGIRFYLFIDKNGKKFYTIGWFGSSGTRDNDSKLKNIFENKGEYINIQLDSFDDLIL